jgi:methylmalonyl-CoA/ethylmalonyl-CoA epimerase
VIERIDHIAIAVRSLEEHIPFYRDVLNLEYRGTEVVEDQKVRLAVFRVGEVKIELLEPTEPDSPISAFIDKRGEGMHHISYQVDDIEGQIAELKDKQVRMIDETPRRGAHGSRIAFLHPRSSAKVLTELTQQDRRSVP